MSLTTEQNIIYEKIETAKGVINYCNEALSHPELEEWERKEYQGVKEDSENELVELEERKQEIEYYLS